MIDQKTFGVLAALALACGAAHAQQPVTDPAFNLDAVVHDLKKVIVFSENLLVSGSGLQCLVELSEAKSCLDRTRWASRSAHDALGVFGDEFEVHPRPLAELALDGCTGAELH